MEKAGIICFRSGEFEGDVNKKINTTMPATEPIEMIFAFWEEL
jgi:hypothetical protein